MIGFWPKEIAGTGCSWKLKREINYLIVRISIVIHAQSDWNSTFSLLLVAERNSNTMIGFRWLTFWLSLEDRIHESYSLLTKIPLIWLQVQRIAQFEVFLPKPDFGNYFRQPAPSCTAKGHCCILFRMTDRSLLRSIILLGIWIWILRVHF